MSSEKILMATRNKGKARELKALLEDMPWEILTLDDFPWIPEVAETGATFLENARIKAYEACKMTRIITVADDSGLMVEALKGSPGIYSARFAGEPASDEKNNLKLLELMRDVPSGKRAARFVSVIAIAFFEQGIGPRLRTARGECRGEILDEPRGSGGFGYDPLFYIPELNKTMAELTLREKTLVSHRGIALRKAVEILRTLPYKAVEGTI
jgi:XTP/dITP diphosphohydrolase